MAKADMVKNLVIKNYSSPLFKSYFELFTWYILQGLVVWRNERVKTIRSRAERDQYGCVQRSSQVYLHWSHVFGIS